MSVGTVFLVISLSRCQFLGVQVASLLDISEGSSSHVEVILVGTHSIIACAVFSGWRLLH